MPSTTQSAPVNPATAILIPLIPLAPQAIPAQATVFWMEATHLASLFLFTSTTAPQKKASICALLRPATMATISIKLTASASAKL